MIACRCLGTSPGSPRRSEARDRRETWEKTQVVDTRPALQDASLGARTLATTPDHGCWGVRPSSGRAEAASFCLNALRSGSERWCEAMAVDVHRHRVHTDRIRDQVQQLTSRTDRMRPPQPQRVVEMPVDALRIIPTLVERLEVRVTGWDLTDVLGPVELALPILVVRVQPDGDCPAAEALGQPVVVVPAKGPALVGVAMCADAFERHEHRLTDLGDFTQLDPTTFGDQPHLDLSPICGGNGLGFDVGRLLEACASCAHSIAADARANATQNASPAVVNT